MKTNCQLTQSPEWDDQMSLQEMFDEAMFFILRKQHVHGDLAYVILGSNVIRNEIIYDYRLLNHDRYGVICTAEGTIKACQVSTLIDQGLADLTLEPKRVLRHIWEVMECHPNVEKLFTQYETV